MRTRCLALLGGLAVMIIVVPVAVVGQAPTTESRTTGTWTPPRTPWGDPDLQGLFTNNEEAGVPFERPRQFGERKFVTDEEFAAREAQAKKIVDADDADFEARPGAVCPDDPDVQCNDQAAFEGRPASAGEERAE